MAVTAYKDARKAGECATVLTGENGQRTRSFPAGRSERTLEGNRILGSTLVYIVMPKCNERFEILEDTQLYLLCMETTSFYSITD